MKTKIVTFPKRPDLIELNRRPKLWASYTPTKVLISVYGYHTQSRGDIRV